MQEGDCEFVAIHAARPGGECQPEAIDSARLYLLADVLLDPLALFDRRGRE